MEDNDIVIIPKDKSDIQKINSHFYLRYIPNDTLKWLKNSRFYGSIDRIFDVSFSMLQPGKEAQMGKSLNGKELGKGISQRKDGLYQARFVNRFGKRETIYAKTKRCSMS